MSTKKKPPKTRKKPARRTRQHQALCQICKSEQRIDFESRYALFDPVSKLANDFGFSEWSIYRHAAYFGLDATRAADTHRVLQTIIGRGLSEVRKVDATLMLGAIRELNRITGKHKQPETNPRDVERQRNNRQWAEERLTELMARNNLSRDEALAYAKEHAPTVAEWIM